MTITLPDALKDNLDRRARDYGFPTADEYVAWLIEEDTEPFVIPTPQQLGFADQAALEAHLLMSLNSGPGVVVDDNYLADRLRELDEDLRRQREGVR